jgi:hypothetical protein
MDLESFAASVHEWAIADWIRTTVRATPILESAHVVALVIVFGTILVVDLRLLGLPNTRRSFTRITNELLPVTWWAFIAAAITGSLLFTLNSLSYYANTAFRVKMVLLLLAGINMFIFHRYTMPSVAAWDRDMPPPTAARMSGAISLVLWISVIFLGRWIGFTKGYDFGIPESVDIDSLFITQD